MRVGRTTCVYMVTCVFNTAASALTPRTPKTHFTGCTYTHTPCAGGAPSAYCLHNIVLSSTPALLPSDGTSKSPTQAATGCAITAYTLSATMQHAMYIYSNLSTAASMQGERAARGAPPPSHPHHPLAHRHAACQLCFYGHHVSYSKEASNRVPPKSGHTCATAMCDNKERAALPTRSTWYVTVAPGPPPR